MVRLSSVAHDVISEKQRSPAYCDRVLHWTVSDDAETTFAEWWRQAPDSPGVEQVEYTSAHELRLSDHKPVRAVYTVQVQATGVPRADASQCSVVDAEQQRKVLGSIVRALDSIENQSIPDASLSSNQLQFQDLRFMEPQSQSITLQNTGQVQYGVAWVRFALTRGCRLWSSLGSSQSWMSKSYTLHGSLSGHWLEC